ncbi:hypothetical protein OGAPHI_000327 [Ogataea philodendri]|uniref:Nuclear control of ATPase protein 2 n=1 Tax=Ogataea philodendri TaxID=1378263 RepID=A0A9P8PI15_9ASCO|nr:uncharacterized protein OGAPHI_000327 [Ogataea philodendri]KAH3671624.1 hypothetical protein OGAPHI_000327 [Ogataea philodendri]
MSVNLLVDRSANSLAPLNDVGLEILSRLETEESKSPNSLLIQELFSETYTLLKPLQDKNRSARSNKQILAKLTKILSYFKDGVIEPQNDNLVHLQYLISVYATMSLVVVSSQILLNNTLKVAEDIDYYDSVSNTGLNVCFYAVQTLPLTLSKAFHTLLEETVQKNVDSVSTAGTVPDWVPEKLAPLYATLHKWARFAFESTSNNLQQLLLSPTTILVAKHRRINGRVGQFGRFVSTVLGLPLTYARMELKQKQDVLEQTKLDNVQKLGFLLKETPFSSLTQDSNHITEFIPKLANLYSVSAKDLSDTSLDASLKSLALLCDTIPSFKTELEAKRAANQEPRNLVKYWLPIVTAVLYGPNLVYDLVSNREAILQWFRLNLVETTLGFWNNWIVEPFNNILKTIRHDDNSRIAIMSQKSLSSDLESLERMVLDYSLDNYSYVADKHTGLPSDYAQTIKQEVQQGNLEIVMKGYENDLKAPLKSLIAGDMIRNLLIQIQKMKVDGALAMSGIDKIIRSQELVFGFVAASPSCLIVWYLVKVFNSYLKTGYFIKFTKNKKIALRKSLNGLERLVDLELTSSGSSTYLNEGLLLLELVNLRKLGLQVLPPHAQQDWIRDLDDLSNQDYDYHFKLMTITRIWNNYRTFIE